eukprot:3933828-Rhodomonas_salina.8
MKAIDNVWHACECVLVRVHSTNTEATSAAVRENDVESLERARHGRALLRPAVTHILTLSPKRLGDTGMLEVWRLQGLVLGDVGHKVRKDEKGHGVLERIAVEHCLDSLLTALELRFSLPYLHGRAHGAAMSTSVLVVRLHNDVELACSASACRHPNELQDRWLHLCKSSTSESRSDLVGCNQRLVRSHISRSLLRAQK